MLAEVDPIGNLIGTYVGREPELTAVMSGSHLDTVPAGGNFDGALGIIAALECVRSWQEEGYRPKRTVQVIATSKKSAQLLVWLALAYVYAAANLKNSSRSLSCI